MKKGLVLLLAAVMIVAFGLVSCSQTEYFEGGGGEKEESDRVYAVETSYEISQKEETYGSITYVFPIIEGMTNMTKQANANGIMKRYNMQTTTDNNGNRGPISTSYEVMIANDEILSVRFPTTLDCNIPTRGYTMIIKHGTEGKAIYSIDNIFGRAEETDKWNNMRAVFNEAGADASQTDEEFWKNLVYFEGDDMKNLTLHMTFFTDKAYDIAIPFPDVTDYIATEKEEIFDFAL